MPINRIRGKLEKLPQGTKVRVINNAAYLKQLADLEPGTYEFIIQPFETKLKRMKRAYFAMESELAHHLGYQKSLLHEQLKEFIGMAASENGEKPAYISVSHITNEADMLERIQELALFAAEELKYTFVPYNPEE